MKTHWILVVLLLVAVNTGLSQFYAAAPRAALVAADDEKDPAYKLYSEGYAFILADKWKEAIKKFDEMKAKFPSSKLLDGAAYWSAYAQKRIDKQKGIAAYEVFLRDYPESRYVADAIADMDQSLVVVGEGANNLRVKVAPGAYTYSHGSSEKHAERAMRMAEQQMRRVERQLSATSSRAGRLWRFAGSPLERKELDPQTRFKIETIRALGDAGGDRESFATLKDVALDRSQSEHVRIAAVQTLVDFDNPEVFTFLVDIARNDANDEVQMAALHSLAEIGAEKEKAADALISLFDAFPKQPEKQQATLYAIADIGNDKAVDFLVKVATTNENYDLRADAVYYLGSIGSEKSRKALNRILKSK